MFKIRHLISYKSVFQIIAINLVILGLSLFFCANVALFYHEPIQPFVLSSGITLLFSLVLRLGLGSFKNELNIRKREAILAVTFSWVVVSLLGSLPYIFSGTIPMYTDALFESISGFTTTGSSILQDIESLPYSILFWRSLTHWIGGIGIIVIVIIVLPSLKTHGYELFSLESSLSIKIKPRIKSTGKRLLLIYVSLTLLEVFFLKLGGMNFFDSICHSFGTIATGGFSTKNNSIAGYSPYIQNVIMIFMLLSGINFGIYYFMLTRDYKRIMINDEVTFYLKVVIVLGLIISLSLFFKTDKSIGSSLREGFFQLISIVSSTGFSTTDYLLWPESVSIILLFAMFLGGCTGSTSGGIKMARHIIIYRNIRRIIQRMITNNAVIPIKINSSKVESCVNNMIVSFVSIYLLVFTFSSIILILFNIDAVTAASSVATCLGGIGPGFGSIGPVSNFSHFSPTIKLILSFVMITGRLEIYSVLVLFTPSFWKT
jgi:trk system potassium uptake protein TrkH